jgi:formyltetrahydrofolate deformylase
MHEVTGTTPDHQSDARNGHLQPHLRAMPARDVGPASLEAVRDSRHAVTSDSIGSSHICRPASRLLMSGPAQAGAGSAIWHLLHEAGADVLSIDQRARNGKLFIRAELGNPVPAAVLKQLTERFTLDCRVSDSTRPKRLAILVSRYDHCLVDLLRRCQRAELDATIGLVVSNHADTAPLAHASGVCWHHVAVDNKQKAQAEARLLELLQGRFDAVVLARYMQILSADFLSQLDCPVINIHHSLLPAFVGAGTYERAVQRGVKLVVATAHYVVEELDAGPIIEQDAVRVTDRDDVDSVTRAGADLERVVLARAVRWHCEDRVVVHDNATIVFCHDRLSL